MPSFDEIRDNYKKKLDQIKSDHKQVLESELRSLQSELLEKPGTKSASELARNLVNIGKARIANQTPPPLPAHDALFNITDSSPLKDLDEAFLKIFNIGAYLPANRLRYKTIYCESLEEFFSPFLSKMNYSQQTRENALAAMIKEAEENAANGGTFGVNFPGQACYINGWLISTLYGTQPSEYRQHPRVLKRVLNTAAHEKLGHGFLSVFSEIGRIKSAMDLNLVQIAANFRASTRDDAASALKYEQHRLIFSVTSFLEEGWSTWIQKFFSQHVIGDLSDTPYTIEGLINAIDNLPAAPGDQSDMKKALLQALYLLLSGEEVPMSDLHQAMRFVEKVDQSMEEIFMQVMGQPLKYVLGYLLLRNCEVNLGELCAPYAALIAANVTFDPTKIGIADLEILLTGDPRLHPNTRLAAISKMQLWRKNDIHELTERVASELSLSIPAELKK